MEDPDQINLCAICLSDMGGGGVGGGGGGGGGQAIFTAECSHRFHFRCISTSVAHGHLVCPLCNAAWRDLPFVRPTPAPPPTHPRPTRYVRTPGTTAWLESPAVFDDDEQVEPSPGPADGGAASIAAAVVETHGECSAIARDSSRDSFAVLVHVKAPGMVDAGAAGDAQRAPLDLVTVLDVSGSMGGRKLALVKQAMRFVIDNLGPLDRLSVVSFSSDARRVTRLTRMSDAGKVLSMSAVEFLAVRGGTNIAEGLRTAAKVLDERRYRNAVSSVILLSDGQDTYTTMTPAHGGAANYEALVPPSFVRSGAGDWSAPIHTFGFGNDHDAVAMHVVAEATGGTFSFIENEAAIQDAFAQCIGGLLSVVVQEARIAVACVLPGVRVTSVRSGRYESRVADYGRAASVRVGELYADEERRFLLFLVVPRAAEATDGDATTLMKVVFSYRDTAAGRDVAVMAPDTVLTRPEHVVDAGRSTEVERELVRVEAADDIAAARAAAERGAHQEAVGILENRQRAVAQSDAARDGDPMTAALAAELQEMRARVLDRQSYNHSGRAYMLAGMSMHAQQRASSRQMVQHQAPMPSVAGASSTAALLGSGTSDAPTSSPRDETTSFATPSMRAMMLRSRQAREQEQEQEQAGEGSGPKVPRK